MTILQILYFLSAAEHGSLSKAAEANHISQPALSLQIKSLEQEIGCELFRRDAHGVSLNASGRIFMSNALAVREEWQRLTETCKHLNNAVCSEITIGLGPRVFSLDLFEPLVEFFHQHQDTSVTFVTEVGVSMLRSLEEKKMDIAITRLPPLRFIPHRDRFYIHPLVTERQCVICSETHPIASRSEIRLEDLDGYDFISGPEGSMDDLVLRELREFRGLRIPKIHRAQDISTIMALIRSGSGVALGPSSFVRKYGGIAVPIVPRIDIALNLITLKANRQNAFIKQTERYLEDVLASGKVDLPSE